MEITSLVKVILDSLYDGILIVDSNSIVRYVNKSYSKITSVAFDDIVGKPLSVRPGSKLQTVLQTGEQLLGVHRKVGDREYIVNMVPIIENEKITGGISLLNDISDIGKLTKKLKRSGMIIKDLEAKVRKLKGARYTFDDIIYTDQKSLDNINLAKKIAHKDINVLIFGESGTGKELYAHSIHNESSRRDSPFIPVNCATLDNSLLESELFGYQDGAFTGAKKGGKTGLFKEANGGTVFLDEVTEMDCKIQAKLLRALQEKAIRPVGGAREIPIDVRVIAATNKDIPELISKKEFRADLYYRLCVFGINLNPLRERTGDIEHLVNYFLSELNCVEKTDKVISEEVLNIFRKYVWPGNIRELKNAIEYSYMMCEDEIIELNHLPKSIKDIIQEKHDTGLQPLSKIVDQAEHKLIAQALEKYGNSVEGKKEVAKALGISLASLYNKLKKANP